MSQTVSLGLLEILDNFSEFFIRRFYQMNPVYRVQTPIVFITPLPHDIVTGFLIFLYGQNPLTSPYKEGC